MNEPIIVTSYDEQWPILFKEIGQKIRSVLGETALRIDHIGSTSVPNLDAKPIIDIQISVASLEHLDTYKIPLASIGFIYQRNNPDLTKRYFREQPGERRTHIHVRKSGSWSEQFALLFRDYLRAHPNECEMYANVKYSLMNQYQDERNQYVIGKGPIIYEIIQRANDWSQRVGWDLQCTDA
ncbi:GrpB family protein [Caldalkalibacillus mannanilyticus]|uniref:GrpB family protein n=1 Tax=Caldalkalibacillus mannanilyticus TaxID=1418 RepID=UPI00046ACBB7|nr:GrpB family protein [Caldalkalibacillus mannanilyticus]